MEKKVIVRGNRSGVFFGTLVNQSGQEVKLAKCRRIYYWEGATDCIQLAVDGVSRPDRCKFTTIIDEIVVTDAIEVLTCTPKSIESISSVKEWKC